MAYAYLVIAEPLRRGNDGGVPSSETGVLIDALLFALIPGMIFSVIQSQAMRRSCRLVAYPALVISYAGAWSVSAYLVAWNYRFFFGTTWERSEVLLGLALGSPQGLLALLCASVINGVLIPWKAEKA